MSKSILVEVHKQDKIGLDFYRIKKDKYLTKREFQKLLGFSYSVGNRSCWKIRFSLFHLASSAKLSHKIDFLFGQQLLYSG